jgi:hypothetical protein
LDSDRDRQLPGCKKGHTPIDEILNMNSVRIAVLILLLFSVAPFCLLYISENYGSVNCENVNRQKSPFNDIIESIQPGDNIIMIRTRTLPSFYFFLSNPLLDRPNTEHLLKEGTLHPHFTVLLRYEYSV